jgi:hypothetical protein
MPPFSGLHHHQLCHPSLTGTTINSAPLLWPAPPSTLPPFFDRHHHQLCHPSLAGTTMPDVAPLQAGQWLGIILAGKKWTPLFESTKFEVWCAVIDALEDAIAFPRLLA